MLTPNEYDHLCDQLMHIYWDLDDAIIADITRRLMKTGGDYLPETAVLQAERMQQAGLLYEDIIAEVAKRSSMTQRQVAKTFERAGVQCIRNDNRAYNAAGLEGIVKMSDACLQTLNAGYVKCNGELQNLTLTTANTAQTAYLNACDLAYMEVSTGTLSYTEAIRRAVRAAADQGAFVLYPSGHRDRLDVAVRRSVLTGVGQTVRKLSEINAHDMGCDLMEITAHAGARPTHAVWQGRIVSLSGRHGYLSLRDIGYGDADGFGGINCRHDWYPFFEGISKRAYTEERLQELNTPHIDLGGGKLYTDYEVSQMQRALEREVRKCKRWVSGAAAGVDSAPDAATLQAMRAELTDASVALKRAEKELQDFCGKTGFLEDDSRVWVNGFGRSEAQRAVWANRRATSGSSGDLSESFFDRLKRTVVGRSCQEVVHEFTQSLSESENKAMAGIFQRTLKDTIFMQSSKRHSYFKYIKDTKQKCIYLTRSARLSTVAHELFHKIDFENRITKRKLLDDCIQTDYQRMKNISETSGQTIEDMLYLKYPEAFESPGKLKEEYCGFSDIIHGMSGGKINLGYGHYDEGYWDKPKKLQKETFAQFGRMYYEGIPDVIWLLHDALPATAAQIDSILSDMIKYGR